MEVSQNEQKEENDSININILPNEIKSWNDFRNALKEGNALLFINMLSECRHNDYCIRAASVKGEYLYLNHYSCS